MICNNCGSEIQDDETICPVCGKEAEIASAETEAVQPVDKKEKRKISTVSKIIAAVSSVMFLISMYLPLFSTSRGSASICLIFGEYFAPIMTILVICTAIFILFQFTNHKRLSVIGLVGIWIVTLVFSCMIALMLKYAAEGANDSTYTLGAGFYLLYIGIIGQIAAWAKK